MDSNLNRSDVDVTPPNWIATFSDSVKNNDVLLWLLFNDTGAVAIEVVNTDPFVGKDPRRNKKSP